MRRRDTPRPTLTAPGLAQKFQDLPPKTLLPGSKLQVEADENSGKNGSPHAKRTWSLPTTNEGYGPILDCSVPVESNQSGSEDDTGKSGEGPVGLQKMSFSEMQLLKFRK
jgi:hypothetical protein